MISNTSRKVHLDKKREGGDIEEYSEVGFIGSVDTVPI